MEVDQFGLKIRKIEVEAPTAAQGGVAKEDVKPVQILMTPQLKQAAKALQKTWGQHQEEQLVELGIENVHLKFTDDKQREKFLIELKKLAPLINVNFPKIHPLTQPAKPELPVPHATDGVWANFWRNYFLPGVFDELVNDLAGTELKTISTPAEILKTAQAYLAAFSDSFVRVELGAEEGIDVSVNDSLTDSMREAHIRLAKFLGQLVKSLPEPGVHRVIIQEENKIEVDGKQSAIRGAALRALLVLALLRDKAEFTLEEFAKLYHGGGVDDAKTDFDNAMKALVKELPQILSQTPSKNHRTITGIKFLVNEDNAAIIKRLASFYKK